MTMYTRIVTFSSGMSPLWLSNNEFSCYGGKAYANLTKDG